MLSFSFDCHIHFFIVQSCRRSLLSGLIERELFSFGARGRGRDLEALSRKKCRIPLHNSTMSFRINQEGRFFTATSCEYLFQAYCKKKTWIAHQNILHSFSTLQFCTSEYRKSVFFFQILFQPVLPAVAFSSLLHGFIHVPLIPD